MARTHGRILTSIWHESSDFRRLTGAAQLLYISATTSPYLSHCGVMPYLPNNLARLAEDWTPAKITRAAGLLADRQFFVIDQGTSELLVRSFVRRDGLMSQPNMATAMAKALNIVESCQLRGVVVTELRRLYREDPLLPGWDASNGKGLKATHPELFAEVSSEPFPEPFGEPFEEGLR